MNMQTSHVCIVKAPNLLIANITGTCAKDYLRLTVSQLKALCKERHIYGYSKLDKATLVEYLLQKDVKNNNAYQNTVTTDSHSTSSAVFRDVQLSVISKSPNTASELSTSRSASLDELKNKSQLTVTTCVPTLPTQPTRDKTEVVQDFAPCPSPIILQAAKRTKRPFKEAIGKAQQINTKRRKLDMRQLNANLPIRVPITMENTDIPKVDSSNKSNRFRAPLISKSYTLAARLEQTGTTAPNGVCDSSKEFSENYYLDHTLSSFKLCEPLHSITFPPLLIQRKEAVAWSIILSRVFGKDRSNCAMACRTMHYGVSLSAAIILRRDFMGRRFAEFKQKYSLSTTDFWPYLNIRQREQRKAYEMYKTSFLPRLYNRFCPISPRLWANPDHDKQITVALRFVLTRAWLALSTAASGSAYWSVFDVQEVVKDEIWIVFVIFSYSEEPQNQQVQQTFYILESTCEIIGQPCKLRKSSPETIEIEQSSFDNLPLRVDWSEYVRSRLLGSDFCSTLPSSLLEHLKWSHFEEYDRGISRHWLGKINNEGDTGNLKRKIAERYIMACLVDNSVSGRWMTCAEMAQEFSGRPTISDSINTKRRKPQVNLFLPAHHHIEGVYLTSTSGKCLHPALAVVQTPGREYYILRDNGMEVGCEEDGVWPVWRELLQCDEKGLC